MAHDPDPSSFTNPRHEARGRLHTMGLCVAVLGLRGGDVAERLEMLARIEAQADWLVALVDRVVPEA